MKPNMKLRVQVILAMSPETRLGQRQHQTGSPETQRTYIAAVAPLAWHFGKSTDYLWPHQLGLFQAQSCSAPRTAASAAHESQNMPPAVLAFRLSRQTEGGGGLVALLQEDDTSGLSVYYSH
jgi:hypothetical protein